jgi:hypothetical protein
LRACSVELAQECLNLDNTYVENYPPSFSPTRVKKEVEELNGAERLNRLNDFEPESVLRR